jgi:hypothetical protein
VTPLHLAGLVKLYQEKLGHVQASAVATQERKPGQWAQLRHALWMLGELATMARHIAVALGLMPQEPLASEAGLAMALDLRSIELKAHRWLGFVQGVLWTQGIYTIDELRAHVSGKPE